MFRRIFDLESREFIHSTMLKPFVTYMLRCADGSYYLGHTDELEKRIAEHQIKRWTRAKKEALIAGDYDRLHLLAGRSELSHAVRDASK